MARREFADAETAGPVAARYIDKILKGADPGEMPVEELSRTVPAVNLKRAKALGLTVPDSVRVRADRVIE